MILAGRAWVLGDNINTDVIIPGKYLAVTDAAELGRHALEGLEPGFAQKVSSGDILVAGRNFGCGSSREQAAVALKHAGIAAIVAPSFARIFFRNALNIGLPVLECDLAGLAQEGDPLRIDLDAGAVENLRTGEKRQGTPLPAFILEIIREGGLINRIKREVARGI